MNDADAGSGWPADTTHEALRVRFAALRRMAPAQRLGMMDDLTCLVRTLAREGLKRRHGIASTSSRGTGRRSSSMSNAPRPFRKKSTSNEDDRHLDQWAHGPGLSDLLARARCSVAGL